MKTIICDIDGTLFKQVSSLRQLELQDLNSSYYKPLPGVLEQFQDWHNKGYYIIIVTARPESCRRLTEQQLGGCSVCYHQLIMGIGRGERILINDIKEDGQNTARAINVKRDVGLENIGEL